MPTTATPTTATTTTASTTTSGFAALRTTLESEISRSYPAQIERLSWTREQIEAHQRRELRTLVQHARTYSPFHARRLAGLDLSRVEPTDLSALPVMTKTEMMAELDDVFTDRRLGRAQVETALARTGTEPEPILGEYIAFTSGGSSGERSVFVFDRPALVTFLSTVTRSLVARLRAGGGHPPGGLPIAIIGARSAVHLTGAAAALTAGGGVPMRYLTTPVTQPLPEIVAQLNDMRPPMLLGYPTVLARLAAEQQAGRLQITPMVVSCTSEQLTPDLRAAIRAGFGVPVIDTFASTEGLLGQTLPDEDVHSFADDGCIIELVDKNDRPVPPGTPSAKVLITNLTNRLQPLIRYELTDSFAQQPAAPEHGHLRATVQGRSDDVFGYGGVLVHPLVIRSVLVRTSEIAEYQVRQTAAGIDVDAVAPATLDTAGLRRRLAAALAAAGLTKPEVRVRTVPLLGRHPETGKLRRFVPLS